MSYINKYYIILIDISSKIITDIKIGENKISSALEMAEAFNCHFANIGQDLAEDIPSTVKEPEYYLNPTNKTFIFEQL